MSNTIKYKGYVGTMEYSAEDDCIWGKIINADGLVLYSGETLEDAKKAFMEMVDGETSHQ
ncbi:MAG: DNA repair protein [Bacillota bacterium]|nr:DNA repair protein [Bacillota bacterium]